MNNQGEKYKELKSTQLFLKDKFETNHLLPHLYYVLAEKQTDGRGRSDHAWVSQSGNLFVSILLQKPPFEEITWIPHWAAVCLFQVLVDLGVSDSQIQLKLPNDLWMDRSKKIAGILCEKKGDVVFVGIGLNLLVAPPVVEGSGALSQIGYQLTPEQVLEKLLEVMAIPISILKVREVYERYALFRLDDSIEWQPDGSQEMRSGTVVGLGAYGELQVKNEEKIDSLFVEDVRLVRLNLI